jgi:hypothetical protein
MARVQDSSAVRVYAIVALLVAWGGVLLQCYLSLKLAAETGQGLTAGLISFFGFFTVLTNILVCFAFTFPVIAKRTAAGQFFANPFAVAGVATSIAFVGISYHLLLRNVWNPQGAQLFANVLLHYVTPALFVIYWLLFWRRGSLQWRDALAWALYPTAYFVYALVRGHIIGSYPYGFIDVSVIGFQRTLINAIALLCVFILLGLLTVWLDHRAPRPIG